MSSSVAIASGSRIAKFLYREGVLNSSASKKSLSKTNPFLAWQNPHSKCWRPSKYSLRRQADLVKEARKAGVEHLLPRGLKNRDTPVKLVVKERAEKPSELLLKLNAARSAPKNSSSEPSTAAETIVRVVKRTRRRKAAGPVTAHLRKVDWVGTPKERTSFGLYGKRRLMFKGHKWEKLVLRRKAAMRQVVAQVQTQKRNMRYVSVRVSASNVVVLILSLGLVDRAGSRRQDVRRASTRSDWADDPMFTLQFGYQSGTHLVHSPSCTVPPLR